MAGLANFLGLLLLPFLLLVGFHPVRYQQEVRVVVAGHDGLLALPDEVSDAPHLINPLFDVLTMHQLVLVDAVSQSELVATVERLRIHHPQDHIEVRADIAAARHQRHRIILEVLLRELAELLYAIIVRRKIFVGRRFVGFIA